MLEVFMIVVAYLRLRSNLVVMLTLVFSAGPYAFCRSLGAALAATAAMSAQAQVPADQFLFELYGGQTCSGNAARTVGGNIATCLPVGYAGALQSLVVECAPDGMEAVIIPFMDGECNNMTAAPLVVNTTGDTACFALVGPFGISGYLAGRVSCGTVTPPTPLPTPRPPMTITVNSYTGAGCAGTPAARSIPEDTCSAFTGFGMVVVCNDDAMEAMYLLFDNSTCEMIDPNATPVNELLNTTASGGTMGKCAAIPAMLGGGSFSVTCVESTVAEAPSYPDPPGPDMTQPASPSKAVRGPASSSAPQNTLAAAEATTSPDGPTAAGAASGAGSREVTAAGIALLLGAAAAVRGGRNEF